MSHIRLRFPRDSGLEYDALLKPSKIINEDSVMSKIHMMALYRVRREKLDEVREAVADFVAAVKENEPGTLFYEAYQGVGDLSFFHVMTFEDEAAEENHRRTPHMEAFVKKLYPSCEEEPGFVNLDLIGSNVRQEQNRG
jgi:quinol monooxygenase YgiN